MFPTAGNTDVVSERAMQIYQLIFKPEGKINAIGTQ